MKRSFFIFLFILVIFLFFLVGCQFNNPFLETELEDITPYLGVYKHYFTTNLQRYCVAGYFPAGDSLYLNGNPVSWDSQRGYRTYFDLSDDVNYILLEAYDNTTCVTSLEYEIKYDPEYNTQDHALLYYYLYSYTIVIDLTQNGILGVIPGDKIVSATPDGKYVASYTGNIYSTATHTLEKTLPYNNSFPVFVENGGNAYCYVGTRKIDFESGSILSSSIPVNVDGRFARVSGDRLARCWSSAQFLNLNTDTIAKTVSIGWGCGHNHAGSFASPNLIYGATTSCSSVKGYIRVRNISTDTTVGTFGSWDWPGQVTYLTDDVIVAGACGNSYYGGGGLRLINLTTSAVKTYGSWGATSVVAYNNDVYFVTTRQNTSHGRKGSRARRGITVYSYDGTALSYKQNFFLNCSSGLGTRPLFFIKP